jgi:hypothetical protein
MKRNKQRKLPVCSVKKDGIKTCWALFEKRLKNSGYPYVKGPTLLLTPLLTNPLNSSTKLQKQGRFQN